MKSDKELNALFEEHVTKWRGPVVGMCFDRPDWTEDANAVLPWLEKHDQVHIAFFQGPLWRVRVSPSPLTSIQHEGQADTFPRAAVIALLRAKGVEV